MAGMKPGDHVPELSLLRADAADGGEVMLRDFLPTDSRGLLLVIFLRHLA